MRHSAAVFSRCATAVSSISCSESGDGALGSCWITRGCSWHIPTFGRESCLRKDLVMKLGTVCGARQSFGEHRRVCLLRSSHLEKQASSTRALTRFRFCSEYATGLKGGDSLPENDAERCKQSEEFGPVEQLFMQRAVELADKSAGLTAPHPNAGCVIVKDGKIVGEGFLFAQGTECAEVQALAMAMENAREGTAYLNLEPSHCSGDTRAVKALVEAGISRAVIGLPHPLAHATGQAIEALLAAGVKVDVLGEGLLFLDNSYVQEARDACVAVNEALIYRASYNSPFAILKYAMTLDGKIACATGHSAWVSSKDSRQIVFDVRSRSDAIIVGGNTLRQDNPRLTTRKEGGHRPVRIVLSRTLQLPKDAHMWDVSTAPTIVMTQRGSREEFQAMLVRRGVEVVCFDFLRPAAVMDYCFQRGFLQVLWECGGVLSAPAIASNCVHKVMSFIAPKIIGGAKALTPVGELGFVEMTQAVPLSRVSFEKVGPDIMVQGYLQPHPSYPSLSAVGESGRATSDNGVLVGVLGTGLARAARTATGIWRGRDERQPAVINFFKEWDAFGFLSNFSPHAIVVGEWGMPGTEWRTVEHYYQAQKLSGVDHPDATSAMSAIFEAPSPEEAARIGRRMQRERPEIIRPDWDAVKVPVMYGALCRKFLQHPHLAAVLVATGTATLVEVSPNDTFWGSGREGLGENHLGRLLMRLRKELQEGKLAAAQSSHEGVLPSFTDDDEAKVQA